MTVQNQTNTVTGQGNGVATSFSFGNMVLPDDSTQLVVTSRDALGVETLLVEGTGPTKYAVVVASFPGTGSITYPEDEVTPIVSGVSVTMKRVLTLEQQLNLENQGGYNSETTELQFDRLMMIDLQQQNDIDRSMKVPLTFSGTVGQTDEPVASLYLRRNATNDGWDHVSIATAAADASDVAPLDVSLSAAAAGAAADFSREDHVHLLPTVSIAKGGTGSTTAAAALTALAAAGTGIVNTFALTQSWTKGADVAGASPCVLGTDGNYFDITGAVTTNTFTVAAGTLFMAQFDAALQLTHHVTNLNLPGGANITTAAGDILIGFATAANQVKVLVFQKANGTANVLSAGETVQVVNVQDSAVATGTTVVAHDDTIPQNDEGDEYMTLAITPINTANLLKIEVVMNWGSTVAGGQVTMALFQDTTANALAASQRQNAGGNLADCTRLEHFMTAGTISLTTFKVRLGNSSAGTTTFNGISSGRKLGGVIASSITITEIKG